jgi:hypothetical protein
MADPPPTLKIKSTYLSPLTGGLKNVDVTHALRLLQREMLKRIKAKLTQTTFSVRAKKALSEAVDIEVHKSSVVITAKHPAWKALVNGQRAGQMKWLVKAKRPIPIVTETGKIIFRSATPRSMADGKWMHPGRTPSDFLEKARQEARAFMRDKLYREYVNQVRKALSQKR